MKNNLNVLQWKNSWLDYDTFIREKIMYPIQFSYREKLVLHGKSISDIPDGIWSPYVKINSKNLELYKLNISSGFLWVIKDEFFSSLFSLVFYKFSRVSMHYFYNRNF